MMKTYIFTDCKTGETYTLTCYPYEVNSIEKDNIFSIYCRFENTEKAKEFLGDNERFNQYSGKFNFHYTDADWTLKLFKEEIKPIL